MESFFREFDGAVLSTTFDKYCYVNVRHLPRFFDYTTELSYAKIIVENGSVTGGAGGNADIRDQLLTRYHVQKLQAIKDYIANASSYSQFDSHVMDKISFCPNDGGNGIEIFAGRKWIRRLRV